ncbi:hypothetical protein A3Q56_02395 [Intoshia linei]|uniref:Uncharacterized protein n=1 Tax=Intoshia linei TaxID=1819745 RepID=A0A177B6G7_9BILA|nr:hypothetical protein A3Q56_02395 [Intoshia linei]
MFGIQYVIEFIVLSLNAACIIHEKRLKIVRKYDYDNASKLSLKIRDAIISIQTVIKCMFFCILYTLSFNEEMHTFDFHPIRGAAFQKTSGQCHLSFHHFIAHSN